MKDNLETQYIEAAIANHLALESGNSIQANRHMKKRFAIIDEVQTKDFYVSLLTHENPAVKLWAAADLLRSGEEVQEALSVISELGNLKGSIGLTAELAYKRFAEIYK